MLDFALIGLSLYAGCRCLVAMKTENIAAFIMRLSLFYPLILLLIILYLQLSHGIIEQNLDHYGSVLYLATWGLLLANISIDLSLIVLRKAAKNKNIFIATWHITGARYPLFVACVGISVLAYPAAFFITDVNNRFNYIDGASTAFLFCLVLLFTLRNTNVLRLPIIILLLFLLLRGERADIVVALAFFIFRTENRARVEISAAGTQVMITFVALFVLAITSFIWRSGSDPATFVTEMVFQNTVVDVVHVYISGFLYVRDNGFSADPFINILQSLIPALGGVKDPRNFSELLQSTVPNPGGGLAVTAFYMSFGYAGIALCSFVLPLILKLHGANSRFASSVFVLFMFLWLRVNWYGVTYAFRLTEMLFFWFGFLRLVTYVVNYGADAGKIAIKES